MHAKDLEVRQRISGVIPCAGVACFSREAIQHLNDQNQGEAFRTSSFTKDYDIAFRVSELGFKSAFVATLPITRSTSTSTAAIWHPLPDLSGGDPRTSFRRASRPPTASARAGCSASFSRAPRSTLEGSLGTKYSGAGQRGVITSPAVMLAYFALANLTVFDSIGLRSIRRTGSSFHR